MKRVLVLGAGLVAKPLIRYLLEKGYHVMAATRTVSKAEKLIDGHANGRAARLDIESEGETGLDRFIEDCDLAVSLVPYAFHPLVAERCIAHGKHMVTTSYVAEAMGQLDGAAKQAGVVILNEIGVDPGIDHMSAMRIIDGVHRGGGHVVSFKSYCGGLPAPDANDNPFDYKFSWAPRGVLLASRNSAQYLLDGRKVEVPSERLFRDMHILSVPGAGDFEAYPNRDSMGYAEVYGLDGIPTLFRGTLRNMGWCDCMFNFRKLGLLELDPIAVEGKSYADIMRQLTGAAAGEDLRTATARKLGIPVDSLPVMNLQWLDMFSDERVDGRELAPLDVLGSRMFDKLAFRRGERDMIVLFHDFRAEYPDGRRERITSRLVDFGIENGDSAMARTVSLPAAIAANMILQGTITAPGVLRPVTPEIYNPVLDELATLDIQCKEATQQL